MLSRRRLLTLAGVGVLAAGCGPDTRSALQRIRDSKTIRVGIAGEEPYGYLDASGTLTGEAPEVARIVFGTLGVTALDAVQRPFGKLIEGLHDGAFDIVAAGMAVTPGRCQQVAFSRPDFVAPSAFLVSKGNPKRLRSFADVVRAKLPLAVLEGSVELDSARAAGIPDARIKQYDSPADLFRSVFQAEVPVGALTDISLRSMLRKQPKAPLEVTAGVPPVPPLKSQPTAAFGFRQQDNDLREAFNTGLAALQASGDWLRVTAPFGFTPNNRPLPALTTEVLCR
ncbi:ectoine/hydroxyectoine ABC transporter substrate-binding protein EhuB [Pseudonocardia spinosispora]|uniref:ectoine/hydroxyectoine ABC transporter substrate-binding protein EhuB n=1 Tax=Pseudonocardia spinosispora TaxID=103441 RepID=UPI000418FFA5|nr:ectoine/hydroxyectoine ABC transporter substrate-binding protein EhuB [Pseudonocardia spinosispora]